MKRTIDNSSLALVSEHQLYEISLNEQYVIVQIEKIDEGSYLIEYMHNTLLNSINKKVITASY